MSEGPRIRKEERWSRGGFGREPTMEKHQMAPAGDGEKQSSEEPVGAEREHRGI